MHYPHPCTFLGAAFSCVGSSGVLGHPIRPRVGLRGPRYRRIWLDQILAHPIRFPAVPHADAVGATQDENEVTWNAALHTG